MIIMAIFRLSLFNLKKNKRAAFSIMFLVAVTMFLVGISVCNITKVNNTFDKMFEATGSVDNMVIFPRERYRENYKDILEEDNRVSRVVEIDALHSLRTSYKKANEEIGTIFFFITNKSEKKIESFAPETGLTEEQLNRLSHPIWLPTYFQYNQKFKSGDAFTVTLGGRDYPFEIAGFYESGLAANTGNGMKCIISEEDYQLLSGDMDEKKIIGYDCEESLSVAEYIEKCAERSLENIRPYCFNISKEMEKEGATWFVTLFLYFFIAVAFITMISCLFMIRHKISNDIEDQIQSIGVLEALGYRTKDIYRVYIYEYMIVGGIGAIIGVLGVIFLNPLMDRIIEVMIGHGVYGSLGLGKLLGIMLILILIIVLSALGKAGVVKKYPPVVAFRKGINTHHFRKNVLPLTGHKGNINLRLSLKDLLGNTKQNIGMMICIFTSATVILFSFYLFDYFKDGVSSIMPIAGMEASDLRLDLMNGVAPYEIKKKMLEFPEVRKALVTYQDVSVSTKSDLTDELMMNSYAVIYDDFSETENINPLEGQYPKHDNEIMITLGRSRKEGYTIGDSIVIEGDGIERSYIITGIVNSMSNNGYNLYLTSEGYRRAFPSARPCVVELYLKDGVDRHKFSEKLAALYGKSVEDALKGGESGGNYADRIRQAADEKMAQLISLYGVTDVDYAIKIGDTVITGDSENFMIRNISSMRDLAEGQIGPVADSMMVVSIVIVIFSVVVVGVILSILAETTVRKKRKELGIMKAMGYTSRDLMQQIAFRIIPIACVAVVIASICSVYLMNAFSVAMFAVFMDVNFWIMIPINICLILFCYLVTYISAGRIRKITVSELMTE